MNSPIIILGITAAIGALIASYRNYILGNKLLSIMWIGISFLFAVTLFFVVMFTF